MSKEAIYIILPLITLIHTLYAEQNKGLYKYFYLSLAFTILNELVVHIQVNFNLGRPSIFYNIYMPICFIIYYQMYKDQILDDILKKTCNIFTFLIVGIAIFEAILFVDIFNDYFKLTYYIGTGMLLYLIFNFLKQTLVKEEYEDIYHNNYFWISLGLLLFYIPFLPIFFTVNFTAAIRPDIFFYIVLFLNILMHIFFNLAFRWKKKN
ncbi:MAG: hypothetical protein RLZZ546_1393 [Bacteroidota bacterium]